jgi:sterol 3beta-glucosyltransferase
VRGSSVTRSEARRTLTLHLYSAVLQPRPQDWPAHHVITGFMALDKETRARIGEQAPPAGLQQWLDAGPPPVFLGFGSMPVGDPARMLALVEEVARTLDVRCLVGAAWSGIGASGISASDTSGARVFVAAGFDHDTILPRCAAAVHHGGAGTTHAAVRAGLPSVVCHFLVDQPYWGRRLIAHGIGARLSFHTLHAEQLIAALRPLLAPKVKARAEALGAAVRAEDGVAAGLHHLAPLLSA